MNATLSTPGDDVGILFLADDLLKPSHLWMRRMLDGLGEDVAFVASGGRHGTVYGKRYRCVRVRMAPLLLARAARRVGLVQRLAPGENTLRRLVDSATTSTVFVHYLTLAVQYDRLWHATDKPVVVHCHGWDVTWDLRSHGDKAKRVHAEDYLDRVQSLPENVRFIANSCKTRDRLEQVGVSGSKIDVKYLGVEIPPDAPARPSRTEGLAFLYLGNLVDFKGPDLLVQAFERACEMGLDATLTLAGDGPLRSRCEQLRAQSRHRSRIRMLGAVDRESGERLRRDADVFTAHNCLGRYTGQEEAFGVSIVEAMAAALPVVSGRSGSLPEVVEDGVQGILVEPGNVPAQAEALLRLGRDPQLRAKMGRAGWQRARDFFSTQTEIARLREILGLPPAPGTDREAEHGEDR